MINRIANNKKIVVALYLLTGIFSLLLFLKNAWVAEDAFIILRSVDQFMLGNGFRWNPHERVQVYTSPLWYLLIIASTAFCKTLYLNLIAISLLLHVALLIVMAVLVKNLWRWMAAVVLLTLSQGFFDFTASGLEYPLIYLLLAIFVLLYLRGQTVTDRYWLALCSGLALITRHDLLFILTPMLLQLAWVYRQQLTGRQQWSLLMVFIAPLAGWTLFSLLYYGMPFPNTAYAKLGISGVSRLERLERGWIYLSVSLQNDPVTPFAIAFSALQGFCSRNKQRIAVATGLLLAFLYISWIGADYMIGRFYAPLYLVSVLLIITHTMAPTAAHRPSSLLAHRAIAIPLVLAAGYMFFYTLLANLVPLGNAYAALQWPLPTAQQVQTLSIVLLLLALAACLLSMAARRVMAVLLAAMLAVSTQQHDSPWQTAYKDWGRLDDIWWNLNNVSRERYWIYRWTSLYAWIHRDPDTKFPDHPWCREGQAMQPIEILGFAGMIPYCMGPDKIAIDVKAITDPLLARMPKSPEAGWASGGVNRMVPAGYLASLQTMQNRIEDPELARYYDKLVILTRSEPLLTTERLKTIIAFNLGRYDPWLESYNARLQSQ